MTDKQAAEIVEQLRFIANNLAEIQKELRSLKIRLS